MADKTKMNLIVCGHVDQGKSTTVGHLLVDLGIVDQRKIDEFSVESEKTGKGDSFKYAWVLDNLKDERERGVTIDLAFQRFESQHYDYTLIDAPGHRDFIKNMITGASEADAACLVVSAKKGETETGIGPGGQSREHAFLLRTLGVSQIAVLVNKMDDDLVAYKEERYNEVCELVTKLLKTVGYDMSKVLMVPISGWKGDNLTKRSENMSWYKGPTMLECLDKFEPPHLPFDKPLRLPVQDVYTITGVGTVPVGRVETGRMNIGDKLIVMPGGLQTELRSVETHHTPLKSAQAGDNIGFNLRGIAKNEIRRGDVIGHPDNPPTVAAEFTARIIVVYHPTAIAAGYTPVIHAHTTQGAATITELVSKIDGTTGQPSDDKPKSLKSGDGAIVKIMPLRPMCIESFSEFPELGRFALRDMGATVAAGVVQKVDKIWSADKK